MLGRKRFQFGRMLVLLLLSAQFFGCSSTRSLAPEVEYSEEQVETLSKTVEKMKW
jgi:hypothetical protein